LLKRLNDARSQICTEDDPHLLVLQHELARTYADNGEFEKAVKLREHVVQQWVRSVPKYHPDRLAAEHELAVLYSKSGRVDEAIKIFEGIVDTESRTLSDHPERLKSEGWLRYLNKKVEDSRPEKR
jgi:lipopolysaccharide biosynthesis regulator YciM